MAQLFLRDPIHPIQLRSAMSAVDLAMEKFYEEANSQPLEHIIHKLESIVEQVGLQASMAGREYAAGMSGEMSKMAWVPDDWDWKDDAKKIISHLKLKPKKYIMDAIHHALMTGEGPPVEELAKDLGYEQGKAVARTVTMNIYAKSALKKWAEDGIEHVKRLAMEDNKTCPICRALNGKEYLVSELLQMPNPQSHDTHENCILGETPVLAPGARKGYVGLYEGPTVEIVFEGGRVVTTPNHMFLTPVGFASAASLREGDDILYYLGFEGPIPGADPDDYREPAPIEKVVNSFSESSGVFLGGVPVAPEDLHGDGMFFNGQIDIASPDSLLKGNVQSRLFEEFCESNFGWRYPVEPGLSGGGNLATVLFALAFATDSSVGIRRQSGAFSGRKPLHPDLVGLAPTSYWEPGSFESSLYGGAGYAKSLGHVQDRFSDMISTRKVLHVNVSHSSLPMYDLQTASSLYIANGLVSSNCRCTFISIIDISTYAPLRRALPKLQITTKHNTAENVPVELYSMLKQIMHGSKLPFNLKFDKSIKADYRRSGDALVINPKTLADEDLRELIYSEQAEEMWPLVKERVIEEYIPLLRYGFAKTSRSWETPREAFVNNWIAFKLGQAPFNQDLWGQAFFRSIQE